MAKLRRAALFAFLALAAPAGAQAPKLFEAHSAAQGGGKMDISVREIERRPRSSVLAIDIRQIGSSVGSSFFLLCSIHQLAKQRGTDHIVKIEEFPARRQMLVGFLNSPGEPPAATDPAFAGFEGKAQVVGLAQFAPICDAKK